MTRIEMVEEKNNKLKLLGKEPVYFIGSDIIYIDLGKVETENLVIPDFVDGIINSKYQEGYIIENNIIETIKFNKNIKFIKSKAFFALVKLRSISSLENVLNLDMKYMFFNCKSLIEAPELPKYVTNLQHSFCGCECLVKCPVISNSVGIMDWTFKNCVSLKEAPEIPNSVKYMSYTFDNCVSLKIPPVIPNSVTDTSYTFYGCTSLIEKPNIQNSVNNSN